MECGVEVPFQVALRGYNFAMAKQRCRNRFQQYLHAIFSTKERRPYLQDLAFRKSLYAYLGAISKNLECAPLCVGGVEDHVHILFRLGRTITQADWIRELKRASSVWINAQPTQLGKFSWQSGYACFSVSASNLDAVASYIANQQAHHHKASFQDELRAILKKHGESWDEQYICD